MRKLTLTYLDNSGFALELGRLFLAFDFCNPVPLKGKEGLTGGVLPLGAPKDGEARLLLFSHSHGDHYTKKAFALPGCTVVLGSDFSKDVCPGAHILAPLQTLTLQTAAGEVRLSAFPSTDQGVSFLVEAAGLRLFHAGDLNLWHWKHESTPAEITEARHLFEEALRPLAPYAGTLDLAFFPVDPRMGEGAEEGALLFAERLRPAWMIPMHMQGDPAPAEAFAAQCAARKLTQTLLFTRRGQSSQLLLP